MLNQGYFPLTVSLNLLGKHKMPQTGSATCWRRSGFCPGRSLAEVPGLKVWGSGVPALHVHRKVPLPGASGKMCKGAGNLIFPVLGCPCGRGTGKK